MSEEGLLSQKGNAYSFSFSYDGLNCEYLFNTGFNAEYKVVFKSSPYLFGIDKPYADRLFEFSVLAVFDIAGSSSYDSRVSITIIAIFLDFYHRHDENVCFYICDSSDGRQMVRMRKFSQWLDKYNEKHFEYKNAVLVDEQGEKFPVAILLRDNNQYKPAIFADFDDLVKRYSK